MMLQVVASPMIIILTTLEVSFMLLENIYITSVTYNYYLQFQKYFCSKGHTCRDYLPVTTTNAASLPTRQVSKNVVRFDQFRASFV
jgi:hypothetical protein